MDSITQSNDLSRTTNRPLKPVTIAPNFNSSSTTPHTQAQQSSISPATITTTPRTWSHSPALGAQNGTISAYPEYSPSTAEILKRLNATSGSTTPGTHAYEAKRAEILKQMSTTHNMPAPPPLPNAGRRGGRGGGRGGTPSGLKTELGAELGATPVGAGSTPTSAKSSGRGRGRGRGSGRGGGRRKRKRSDTDNSDDDDDSDVSATYTPLPTKTRSGRNVTRPVEFVPTLPEPTSSAKRRKSTKPSRPRFEAALCKVCHRGTSIGNNQVVFCDSCSTPYHQYCHSPPIENEYIQVIEKEWLCGPCDRAKQSVVEDVKGLVAGEGLTIPQRRAYLNTLPQSRLISLLLHSTIRHPELPIFPSDILDIIEDLPVPPEHNNIIKPSQPLFPPKSTSTTQASLNVASPANGLDLKSTSGTPRSQNLAASGSSSSELDPVEAQLLGEINVNVSVSKPPQQSQPQHHPSSTATGPAVPTSAPSSTLATVTLEDPPNSLDDGYDTDPPAHYPKPGNGLARTMRPESEELQWLVDDNFDVFSHNWKGDGTGVASGELEQQQLQDGQGVEQAEEQATAGAAAAVMMHGLNGNRDVEMGDVIQVQSIKRL